MLRLLTLFRLVRNHFVLREPGAPFQSRSFRESAIFFLNLFPPYNAICWLWVKTHLRFLAGRVVSARLARWLVERGFLFGALRHLRPEDKNSFALDLRSQSARPAPHDAADPAAREIAAQVSRIGYAALGPLLEADDVAEAVRYFTGQKGYVSQVPLQSDGLLRPFDIQALRNRWSARYFCFSPGTSLRCPQLSAVVRNPRLREVAAAYLGFEPRLYSVNTFASLEGDAYHYVMRMHRDYDDFMSLAFFINWTTTRPDNGATMYVPGSHVSSSPSGEPLAYLAGEEGTGYAIDTFGLHAGNRSIDNFRLVTWIRYGRIPNLATVQDKWLIPTPPQ